MAPAAVSEPPLAAPVDPANFAISKADIGFSCDRRARNREARRRNAISETAGANMLICRRCAVSALCSLLHSTPAPTGSLIVEHPPHDRAARRRPTRQRPANQYEARLMKKY